jgi:hypothetical protein
MIYFFFGTSFAFATADFEADSMVEVVLFCFFSIFWPWVLMSLIFTAIIKAGRS